MAEKIPRDEKSYCRGQNQAMGSISSQVEKKCDQNKEKIEISTMTLKSSAHSIKRANILLIATILLKQKTRCSLSNFHVDNCKYRI